MKKYIRILNPIYPFTINVFLNYTDINEIKKKIVVECEPTHNKIHRKLDKIKLKDSDGYCFESGGWIFIIIQDFKNNPVSFDTLHHEISHAVDFSAHYIGMKQHKRIREYSAYMHGFITNQIYKKIL